MKFVSIFFSILVHLLFVVAFILFNKSHALFVKQAPIYTVNILQIKNEKPKQNKTTKKTSNVIVKKPKHKLKPKMKPKKLKPKPKPKNKIVKKIDVETKIKKLQEQVKVEELREKLLRRKIETLKKHLASQQEAQKSYKKALSAGYVNIIQSSIYNNWGVSKDVIDDNVFITTVKIKLDYKGNLINLRILKSSGNAYFDGTVIDAIRSSEPFTPPPKEILSDGVVEFIITFDSREKQ
ncbi:energy transducer TonB [Hippea maritima]|uniref:TonB family protein n=1 Tax=Hippea maritima (strain ATCC 700847 / DSM 10411 / MH2) TaxID=760142 RepID=F2LW22_HIPMA|nr:energy transducer TonB [Hippea maritima]AEA33956.1 hypothetical protein Hipma_0990 [Hippea maritima DSM 10411]